MMKMFKKLKIHKTGTKLTAPSAACCYAARRAFYSKVTREGRLLTSPGEMVSGASARPGKNSV